MFINLLDINLQEQILNSSDKMMDIKATLEMSMKEGPKIYKMIWQIGK